MTETKQQTRAKDSPDRGDIRTLQALDQAAGGSGMSQPRRPGDLRQRKFGLSRVRMTHAARIQPNPTGSASKRPMKFPSGFPMSGRPPGQGGRGRQNLRRPASQNLRADLGKDR